MGVGDHQPDALQAALHQRAQESHPELVVLARSGLRTKNRALPGGFVTPTATTVATEITRPTSRTMWKVASSQI